MDLLDRLKILMDSRGDTVASLARNSGIPYTTIDGMFKKGYKNAYISTVQKLCDYFGISLDYLIKGDDGDFSVEARSLASKYDSLDEHGRAIIEMVANCEVERYRKERQTAERYNQPSRLISFIVYDEPSAAGLPLDAGSHYERMDFPEEDVPDDADFGVRILGASMEPTIPDGCIAFVKRSQLAVNNDVVIAWVPDGMVCKRAIYNNDRLMYLKSDNPAFPNITGADLNGIMIRGIVVGYTVR